MKSLSFLSGLLLSLAWFLCFHLDSQTREPRMLLIQSGTIGIRGNTVFHLTEV